MLAALLGAFGSGKNRPLIAEGRDARLELTAPRVIRTGEFFEMRVRITARRAIRNTVLAVPTSLWRDMTIFRPRPMRPKMAFSACDYGAALMDIVLRATVMFVFLFGLLRLMGKRELG